MTIRAHLSKRLFDHSCVEPSSSCWIWTGGQRSTGYGALKIGYHSEGNQRMESAHRVSWQIFRGEIPDGMCVLHRCDVRLCVNPAHLFLGSLTENNQDMALKGRMKGRSNTPKILNGLERTSILYDPRPQRQIAQAYGVSQAQVSKIKRGTDWSGKCP